MTRQVPPKPPATPFPEPAIRATVSGGTVVLGLGLAAGAGLTGLAGLGLALIGCAMSEANFYRGRYRLKPPQEH